MAQKVVLDPEKFEKVIDLFNHLSFPAAEIRKAVEVDTILRQATMLDITVVPSPAPEAPAPQPAQ
jgi:hypothetical protein